MKQLTVISLLLLSSFSNSQNLVLNFSFEDYTNCPYIIGQFNSSVQDWSTPNFASTDYFNNCSETIGYINYNGRQKARTGEGYAGIYVLSDQNYREYIQGKLVKSLEKNKKYEVTFYISLADESSYAIKDIDILFSEEKLKVNFNSSNIEKVINPKKITKKSFELYSNSETVFFADKKNWIKLSFQFTSKGYENYFSIGNFKKNSKTKKHKMLSQSPYYFSYYYIDDISIISLEKAPQKEVKKETKLATLESNKIYTLRDVFFDFDKAELLDSSKEELYKLLNYLVDNPKTIIKIYGHTDNVGTVKRNNELSQQRAKAVADYLILLGLSESKISSFGFGSSIPISDNKTEEGRKANRRVEFKLIEN